MAFFIKKAASDTSYWDTALWVGVLGQIWLLPTIYLFRKELAHVRASQYTTTALIGVAGVIGTLAAVKAYAANVSISSAIIALPFSLLIAFLFSVFAPELLEQHTLKVYAVRFISAIVMIAAALNL